MSTHLYQLYPKQDTWQDTKYYQVLSVVYPVIEVQHELNPVTVTIDTFGFLSPMMWSANNLGLFLRCLRHIFRLQRTGLRHQLCFNGFRWVERFRPLDPDGPPAPWSWAELKIRWKICRSAEIHGFSEVWEMPSGRKFVKTSSKMFWLHPWKTKTCKVVLNWDHFFDTFGAKMGRGTSRLAQSIPPFSWLG